MATPTEPAMTEQAMTEQTTAEQAKTKPKSRQNREFRLMYRPTCSLSVGDAKPKAPAPPRRKISRQPGRASGSSSLVGDLCAKLAEKSGHWALVVLKPTEPVPAVDSPENPPALKNRPRIPIAWNDDRIDRVFEICHPRKKPAAAPVTDAAEKQDYSIADDSDVDSTDYADSIAQAKEEQRSRSSWGWGKKFTAKPTLSTSSAACGPKAGASTSLATASDPKHTGSDPKLHDSRPTTPNDSEEDDRYDSDEGGFPVINDKGKSLTMQVSHLPRSDFSELRFEHLGGTVWEILTGIEARTKFTNSELRHQAMRVWKRQQNYHTLDNNCQQFCVLLAIEIRVKSHYQLLDHHCNTVRRQIKGMTF